MQGSGGRFPVAPQTASASRLVTTIATTTPRITPTIVVTSDKEISLVRLLALTVLGGGEGTGALSPCPEIRSYPGIVAPEVGARRNSLPRSPRLPSRHSKHRKLMKMGPNETPCEAIIPPRQRVDYLRCGATPCARR